MNRILVKIIILIGLCASCMKKEQSYKIQKGKVTYDFSFAELAVKYLETNDSVYLYKISELDALKHLMKHAKRYKYSVPKESELALAKHLLSPLEKRKAILPAFKQNLEYAKKNVAEMDVAQSIASQYLPVRSSFNGTLFFTFGYDLGVAYENNASLNLAHRFYLENRREIKYYSIHELHHAGFIYQKNSKMPSIDITNYRQATELIEYLTHLEGMGTYAPYEIRRKEGALNIDKDYISLQDSVLMNKYEEEYFEIYNHFKLNPENLISKDDWGKISILSNKRRLWYRVGAKMAQTIDSKLGREKLIGLISQPSENFIATYLNIREE